MTNIRRMALSWWFGMSIIERYEVLERSEIYKNVREDSLTPPQIIGLFKANHKNIDSNTGLRTPLFKK